MTGDVHDRIRDYWDRDSDTYDETRSHAISDPLEAAAWRQKSGSGLGLAGRAGVSVAIRLTGMLKRRSASSGVRSKDGEIAG